MHAPRGRELAVAEVIAEVEAPVAREQSAFAYHASRTKIQKLLEQRRSSISVNSFFLLGQVHYRALYFTQV